ncbi:hypothetical protein PHMEG_0004148 [Phytophthora megakarya]|uniref:Uncharacterized protein n=1 Tax=Phytophthora megakarya TaxID=4795 RepID=A0A225WUG3_9STRA|nr:hypothetical protein PHMEG_0004148 [Phytophthora megakarya]
MVETLEDLILEAYNNMQIDGEYIFLPDEVAEKLHRVVEQMKIQEIGEEEQTENKTSAGEDSTGDGPVRTDAEEVKVPQQETPTDRPEPEQEQEQEQKEQVQEREATELEKSVQKQPPALVEDEESKVLTYEKRREAALKLKQDKMKRELRIRESARKQREDAKRQLEEVHQKEMEEKRERVRRIREERLHRRTGKPGGAKGTKKDG